MRSSRCLGVLLELDDQQHENHADRRRCGENGCPQQPAQSHCRRCDGRPNPSSRNPLQSRILTAGPGNNQVFQSPVDRGADRTRHSREGSRRFPSWRRMKRAAHGRASSDVSNRRAKRGDCAASRRIGDNRRGPVRRPVQAIATARAVRGGVARADENATLCRPRHRGKRAVAVPMLAGTAHWRSSATADLTYTSGDRTR
jgi:hypothetical protein